jgi:hypothetical protein
MYTEEEIKQVVDKFVVVFVGAPRGTDTLTWIRNVPEQLKHTMIDTSKDNASEKFLNNHTMFPWGKLVDSKTEFHVCAVTNLYDSMDRYVSGEDHTLGGLTHEPLFNFDNDSPDHFNLADAATHHQVEEMTNIMRNQTIDEHDVTFSVGLKPINKLKWEKHISENFSWCDGVHFSYYDHYNIMNEWSKLLHPEYNYNHIWGTQWANQYLHFEQAYNDNKALFDSLTPNSVVLRIRWDCKFGHLQTMWDFAAYLFQTHLCDQRDGSKSHHIHHNGFSLSPIAMIQGHIVIRGHPAACDYWHCFDGIGAQILGKNFSKWMLEDPLRRLPGFHIMDWDKEPDIKTNYWKYPEGVAMQFLYDNGYTIHDVGFRGNIDTELMSFGTLLTDQYRYTWYDWTDEEIERIKNATES